MHLKRFLEGIQTGCLKEINAPPNTRIYKFRDVTKVSGSQLNWLGQLVLLSGRDQKVPWEENPLSVVDSSWIHWALMHQ